MVVLFMAEKLMMIALLFRGIMVGDGIERFFFFFFFFFWRERNYVLAWYVRT